MLLVNVSSDSCPFDLRDYGARFPKRYGYSPYMTISDRFWIHILCPRLPKHYFVCFLGALGPNMTNPWPQRARSEP